MVEVDVFWAYGIGASCAAAAGKSLTKARDPFETRYFVRTLLLLALFWAPTGLLLLLRHPSWETMQVADKFADIPPWLTLAFGVTNVTQGILGFWVGQRLVARGEHYLAHLNWMLGYFGMFFILLYGWDGLGYDRFLYDRDMFGGAPWRPGAGLGAGFDFLRSSVAMTLYLDGVILLPPLLGFWAQWSREDAARRGRRPNPGAGRWALIHLAMALGPALGTAALSALTVGAIGRGLGAGSSMEMHVVSYVVGLPLSLGAAYALLYAPGRPLHRWLVRTLLLG